MTSRENLTAWTEGARVRGQSTEGGTGSFPPHKEQRRPLCLHQQQEPEEGGR